MFAKKEINLSLNLIAACIAVEVYICVHWMCVLVLCCVPMNLDYIQNREMPRSGLNFVGGPKLDEEGGFMFGRRMDGARQQQQQAIGGKGSSAAYWPSIASFFNGGGGGRDRAQLVGNQAKLSKGIYYPASSLNETVSQRGGGVGAGGGDMFSEIVLASSDSSLEARGGVFKPPPAAAAASTLLQSTIIARLLQQNDDNIAEGKLICSTKTKTISSTASKSWFISVESIIQWTVALAISYSLVLIVLTGLVATLFAQQSSTVGVSLATILKRKSVSLVSEGWIVTAGDCDYWYNGECLPKAGGGIPDQRTLGGIIEEREIKATGLFSSVNVPFLCLASSVISTAFSICLVPNQDERMHKTFKMLSMLIVVVFGTLFLFIQGAWSLPMNNVLLVEFSFMVALFVLMTYSANKGSYVDVARLFDMMLTNPLIAVSVLSASGDDNTARLVLVYFSLVFGHLALVVNFTESVQCDAVTPGQSGVCRRIYWLCMVPWIVQCSFRFHYLVIGATISQPTWSIAALSFTFATFFIRAIIVTFHSWFDSMETEGVCMDGGCVDNGGDGGGSRSVEDWSFTIHFTGMIPWAVCELVIKVVIYLLLIIGFFIELDS